MSYSLESIKFQSSVILNKDNSKSIIILFEQKTSKIILNSNIKNKYFYAKNHL